MTSEQAQRGMRVRVMEHHRVEERRGLMGTVVAVYGGVDYIAVDVRLADGQYRLFWPGVLHHREAYSPPQVLSGVSLDTRCSATLTYRTILDTLDTYRQQRSLEVA